MRVMSWRQFPLASQQTRAYSRRGVIVHHQTTRHPPQKPPAKTPSRDTLMLKPRLVTRHARTSSVPVPGVSSRDQTLNHVSLFAERISPENASEAISDACHQPHNYVSCDSNRITDCLTR